MTRDLTETTDDLNDHIAEPDTSGGDSAVQEATIVADESNDPAKIGKRTVPGRMRRWLRLLRPRVSWLRHRWFLPVLLATLLAGLLGASTWLWMADHPSLDRAPIAVARKEAKNFFSLDYRHADADIDRVLSLATGPFEQQYSKGRDTLKEGLVSKKITMTAQIPEHGAALEYEHGDQAQVLVPVDATTKTAEGANQTSRYRVRVRLTHIDSQWLVSGISQVG